MRGKVAQAMGNTFDAGITPAYAGKSLDQIANDIAVLGSPPRMRGKEPIPLCTTRTVGITPAYAGKSAGPPFGLWCCRDHPRVCGEKSSSRYVLSITLGSPPRMRGKVSLSPLRCVRGWITPAYAGKSSLGLSWCYVYRDHPRVCGEKSHRPWVRPSSLGSPPRMRGKEI